MANVQTDEVLNKGRRILVEELLVSGQNQLSSNFISKKSLYLSMGHRSQGCMQVITPKSMAHGKMKSIIIHFKARLINIFPVLN